MMNQTAYKVDIRTVLDADIKEGVNESYIELGDKAASLFNIIGTIVSIEDKRTFKNAVIDDGTGCIPLRVFSENVRFDIGDVVQVICRLRKFNDERYMTSIVAKKVDRGWFLIRKEELKSIKNDSGIKKEIYSDMKQNEKVKKIMDIISRSDKGRGVYLEEIDENMGCACSEIVGRLLEEGEIFEIEPGKVKCLR